MKIYNKIVFDYDFNIIEEDSFEHEGEVALCEAGGTGADAGFDAGGGYGGWSGAGWSDAGFDRDESSDPSTDTSYLGGMLSRQDDYGTRHTLPSPDYSWSDPGTLPSPDYSWSDPGTLPSPDYSWSDPRTELGLRAEKAKQDAWSSFWGYAGKALKTGVGFVVGAAATAESLRGNPTAIPAAIAGLKGAYDSWNSIDWASVKDKMAKADQLAAQLSEAMGMKVSVDYDTGRMIATTEDGQTLDLSSDTPGITDIPMSQLYTQAITNPSSLPTVTVSSLQANTASSASQSQSGGTNMSNLSLEDQLKQEQLSILRRQREETEALTDLVYRSAGLVKDTVTGKWRQATEPERYGMMTDTQKLEYDAYKQQLDRQQKALAGELPVSPALEREISDWDAQNKEYLSRKLGTDYLTSTPGIQSQARQQERSGLLREEARRGEISAGSGRVLNWKNSLNQDQNNQIGWYSGIPTRTSSLLSGYSSTLAPYIAQNQIDATNNRQAQMLADEAYWRNKEIEGKNRAGMWSGIATGLRYLYG